VITQSPSPSTGSLLLTETILHETAPQPPEVLALTVTGIILWFGGQTAFGLALAAVIVGGEHGTASVIFATKASKPPPKVV
jgi:hypothetical protein